MSPYSRQWETNNTKKLCDHRVYLLYGRRVYFTSSIFLLLQTEPAQHWPATLPRALPPAVTSRTVLARIVSSLNGQNEQAAETPASLYTCNTCKGIFAVMRLQKVTTELTRTTWDSIELFERGCTRANSTLCNVCFPQNCTRIHVSFETQPICNTENTLDTNHWICIITVFSRFEMVPCSRVTRK